jgi:hypothetical protein
MVSLESVDIGLERYETRNHYEVHKTMIKVPNDEGIVLS